MSFDDFNTPPVPGDGETYKEYRRLSIEFIEARNCRLDRYAALCDELTANVQICTNDEVGLPARTCSG